MTSTDLAAPTAPTPSYEVPNSLSPSRVDAFTSCPLAFRFSSIQKLPEPPNIHTTRGSLVHRALELAFLSPAPQRTPEVLHASLDTALAEYRQLPDLTELHFDDAQMAAFEAECRNLIVQYLAMEDPRQVRDIGLELRLEAQVGDLTVRGIIDRLELDSNGELIVTDYKTGRAPSPAYEQQRLTGVHFYSFLCEAVLGRRPAAIRLMFLKTGDVIEAKPSAKSVQFVTTRTKAVYTAIERACADGEFRARTGPLCSLCAFREWCPEYGGDPDLAAVEAPLRAGVIPA